MKKSIFTLLLISTLFSQSGNDRSFEFFSGWFDTILGLEDTSLIGSNTPQRIQDGRGYLTPILLDQEKLYVTDGTDTFSVSVENNTFKIWNDASPAVAIFELDSIGNLSTSNLPLSSFSVYQQDAGQTGILNTTWTKLVWHTEEWDTNNDFAANRFTPSVAGKYVLTVSFLWAAGDISAEELWITAFYKNGSIHKADKTTFAGTGNFESGEFTAIVDANGSTDYFEVYVRHTIGVTKATITSGEVTPISAYSYFQGHGIP